MMPPRPREGAATLVDVEVLAPQVDLGDAVVSQLLSLVATVEAATGHPALSDQSRLALQGADSQPDGRVAVVPVHAHDAVIAFGQLSPSSGGWTLDVVSPSEPALPDTVLAELVRTTLDAVPDTADPTGRVTWWRDGTATGDLESELGFALDRELLQMRRSLPTGQTVTIATRSFVPGRDEASFLTVNNRAFASHHEQSGWTADMVAAREQEPWFDPDGFRLHEVDGRLAGFCWTKAHPADSPDQQLGEIYVIAVDPDFAGRGLGKQLTLAGLEHLSDGGITTAMLYVDADNVSAVAMYERLGFHVHSSTKAFCRQLGPTSHAAEPHSSTTAKDDSSP
jgi:mycothiol synthase